MNSETVYQVAKALPKEEQLLLFEKLKNDFKILDKSPKKRKHVLIREEAMRYLLDHVFNKR
jgi:hypothetical protein